MADLTHFDDDGNAWISAYSFDSGRRNQRSTGLLKLAQADFEHFFDRFFTNFRWVREANMAPKIDKNLKNQ